MARCRKSRRQSRNCLHRQNHNAVGEVGGLMDPPSNVTAEMIGQMDPYGRASHRHLAPWSLSSSSMIPALASASRTGQSFPHPPHAYQPPPLQPHVHQPHMSWPLNGYPTAAVTRTTTTTAKGAAVGNWRPGWCGLSVPGSVVDSCEYDYWYWAHVDRQMSAYSSTSPSSASPLGGLPAFAAVPKSRYPGTGPDSSSELRWFRIVVSLFCFCLCHLDMSASFARPFEACLISVISCNFVPVVNAQILTIFKYNSLSF